MAKVKIIAEHKLLETQYSDIKHLEQICTEHDRTNLKLELDFKKHIMTESTDTENNNEFLYYIDDTLVGYIGIFSMGAMVTAEMNGMVHPKYRRKRIFTELFSIAIDECGRRDFSEVLLLSDKQSVSGIAFIESLNTSHHHSEYQMEQNGKCELNTTNHISLRKADKSDLKTMWDMDVMYFGMEGEFSENKADKLDDNHLCYMIEQWGKVIGKIKVEYGKNVSFIYGFGILPDYRGKGYGREALTKVLRLINEHDIYKVELEVESKNDKALNLYKSCGFQEVSVMKYYSYNL